MSVSKISNRYAKSLIDFSREKGILDVIIEDVKAFLKMTENKDFSLFLRSPIIHADKKLDVFEELVGSAVQTELMDFFKMVIRKGRENILPEILDVVLEKYNEMRGVTTAVITSAVALSEREVQKIAGKLKNTALAGEKIEFIHKIDPALIGGFIIEVGDKRYDASIVGKMKKMKNQLSAK
jgi:F-type H+-transporting ATPase subunit delta